MNRKVITLQAAIQDIADHLLYIAQDSPTAARHFQYQLRETEKFLLYLPEMGRQTSFRSPALKDLRFFPVRKFDHYLIFYRPMENGIEVVRILHTARDIKNLIDL